MMYSGNAFGVFLKNQRRWESPAMKEEDVVQFREFCAREKYDPVRLVDRGEVADVGRYYRMGRIWLILRVRIWSYGRNRTNAF